MLFSANNDAKIKLINQYIKNNLKAPVIYSNVSTLGGYDKAAIMIKLSLDNRDTWAHGIFENSRSLYFSIDIDGTVKCFCQSYKIQAAKFRKAHAKNLIDAVNRINKYLAEIK